MFTHKLGLFENAVDSLEEALVKYQEMYDRPKSSKFAVLHMAHFMELIFKYYVYMKHPLLIYKNPFAKSLDNIGTISLWDAINFINNENKDSISADLRKDLEWLKKVRNSIEHYEFTMNLQEVGDTIGRIFRSVLRFLDEYTQIDLRSKISNEAMNEFSVLSDEYKSHLQEALGKARYIAAMWGNNANNDFPACIDCEQCGHRTMVFDDTSETNYRCLFCGEIYGDNVPCRCDVCGSVSDYYDMDIWECQNGEIEKRCSHCSGRYLMEKDD